MRRQQGKYLRIAMLLTLCGSVIPVCGQSDATFNQHWAILNYYNPATAGRGEMLNLTTSARIQSVGNKNAPFTIQAMGDMPIRFFDREHGVGIAVVSESADLYNITLVGLQYAFKLILGEGALHIGLQPTLANVGFKEPRVDTTGEVLPDPIVPKTDIKENQFDLSAGLYYTLKGWYVGASVAHLIQPSIRFNENSYTTLTRNLYFTAGGNIPLNCTLFELDPTFLARTDMRVFQIEATLRATYNNLFWFGAGYRYDAGAIALLGIRLKSVNIGYSYDYSTSPIVKGTSGNHELFISYKMKLNRNRKQYFRHRSVRIL